MCGIVGYVGNEEATKILIEGLSKLEYRGYDSAGVAVLENEKINVRKCKGRLLNLEEKLINFDFYQPEILKKYLLCVLDPYMFAHNQNLDPSLFLM